MSRVPAATHSYAIVLGLVLILSSCSEITLPRLEWEDQKKDPSVPLRVKLELDASVQRAGVPYYDACGDEKVFPIGIQLSQMLLEDSQKVFQQVVDREDLTLGNFVDAVLHYTVLEKNYDLTIPRLESDAEYPAKAMLRIRAILREERTGKELYAETFEGHGEWLVSSDEDGVDCEPIGIGIPIDRALETISDELVDTLRESGRLQIAASKLVAQRQQGLGGVSPPSYPNPGLSTPVPGAYPIPRIPASPRSVQQVSAPSVQFRTKLVDANRNLVLEGGEALKLLLEIQNVSNSTIPSAYVELRGLMLKATHVLGEAMEDANPQIRLRAAQTALSMGLRMTELKEIERRLDILDSALPLWARANAAWLGRGYGR